jgi:hypothetical protein
MQSYSLSLLVDQRISNLKHLLTEYRIFPLYCKKETVLIYNLDQSKQTTNFDWQAFLII